jgi:putative salt-induced outer membrane protein YdiY
VRRLLPLFLLTVSFLPQAKASSFWGTLENLLNIGCNYTSTFNWGSNWEWICSLKSIYSNIKWMMDNISDYAQSLTFEMLTGVLEGTMQSLGIAIGPGVNRFVNDIDDAVREIRRAPTRLRTAIAKAMVEDAKRKYLVGNNAFPVGSGQRSLDEKKDASPTVSLGFVNEYIRKVKNALAVGGFTTGLAEGNAKFKDLQKSLGETTQLATKMLTPKDSEQATGGVVQKGVADQLIDKAKTAASTREVMEVTVEAIANLLKLQAAMNIAITQQLNQQIQSQLLSNSGLTALYDVLSEQAEREAGDAEAALQLAALAVDEVIRDTDQELQGVVSAFERLADYANNVPNLGDYIR